MHVRLHIELAKSGDCREFLGTPDPVMGAVALQVGHLYDIDHVGTVRAVPFEVFMLGDHGNEAFGECLLLQNGHADARVELVDDGVQQGAVAQ